MLGKIEDKLFDREYSFSFTTMAAQIPETIAIAKLYAEVGQWDQVRDIVQENNLINKNKNKTSLRIFQEISKRLSNLNADELEILVDSNSNNQKAILLIAIANTYRYIRDFSIEVILNNLESHKFVISDTDYKYFYEAKYQLIPALSKISESSTAKLRQRLFTILLQLGIIDRLKAKNIQKPVISPDVGAKIKENNLALSKLFTF